MSNIEAGTIYYAKYKAAVNLPMFPKNSTQTLELYFHIDRRKGKYIWGRDIYRELKPTPSSFQTE